MKEKEEEIIEKKCVNCRSIMKCSNLKRKYCDECGSVHTLYQKGKREVKRILKLRKVTEGKTKKVWEEQMKPKKKKLCQIEIRDNLGRVMAGRPLTRPLRELNENCEFKKVYDELYVKPARNEDRREYNKIFYSIPENREKLRARQKKYNSTPKAIAKRKIYAKEYNSRPEVKERAKEYNKKHYSIPENVERRRKVGREWYQKNKERVKERERKNYIKKTIEGIKCQNT